MAKKLNCLVGIGRGDVLLLEKNEKRKVFGKGIWGRFYAWASNHNIQRNSIENVTPDIILDDGMSLLKYGVDGSVIRLMGHTKGSMGIVLKSGELFVGDAMQNIIFPATTWCFEDYEQVQESVKLIKSINVKKVFFGHGRIAQKGIS